MLRLLLALLLLATPAAARERPGPRRPAAPALVEPLPGTERIAFDAGGTTRRYLLHVPRGAAAGPRPLVLVFHGPGSQGALIERASRFSAASDQAGFVVAYPDGLDGTWQVPSDPRSEIAFVRLMIEDIIRRTPLERTRIFAAGMSNGAAMAAALGCFAPDLVAGVGLVAGGYPSPCWNSPRAPAILFNGTADTTNPIGGRRTLMPVRDFALAWGSGPGCRATAEALPAPGAQAERFACGGAQAMVWTIPGGGHAWPGESGQGPDATREIWRFLTTVR